MANYRNEIERMITKIIQNGIHYDKNGFGKNKFYKELSLLDLIILKKIDQPEITTIKSINEDLEIDRNAINSVINKFTSKGIVEKELSLDDKRKVKFVMTEKGKEKYRMIKEYENQYIEFILESMTINEEKAILKFLSKVNQLSINPDTLYNGKRFK